MSVMSIRINPKKRKALKVIASLEGKTMSGLVEEMIDDYIDKNRERFAGLLKTDELSSIMKVSEAVFAEWDNDEDEIYNSL